MKHRHHYLAVVLAAITLLVFHHTLDSEFVSFDDGVHVYDNPYVTQTSLSNLSIFWEKPYRGLYIPLSYSFWALQARIAKQFPDASGGQALNPNIFHATNLLVHILTALAVFALIRLLLHNDWGALFAALLFAIHPVQVESVAWISEFKGLLSGLCVVVTLWLYVRYTQADRTSNGGRIYYLTATFFLLLAVLSKPGAVVTPFMAAIISCLLLDRSCRRTMLELIPWMILIIPVVIVTRYAQPAPDGELLPSIWQRLLIAGDTIYFYVAKLVYPLNLEPDYGRTPHRAISQGWIYITGLVPYLVIALVVWKSRNRVLLASLALFVVAILPVLGFIPFAHQEISTVTDRYLHIALLGPALYCGWLMVRYNKSICRFVAVILVSALGVLSTVQSKHWHDSVRLSTRTLAVNPGSWIAHNNLATMYGRQGNLKQAITHLQSALKLNPNYAPSHGNLGIALIKTGRLRAAIYHLQESVRLDPSDAKYHYNLGQVLQSQAYSQQAIQHYNDAIRLEPNFQQARNALSSLQQNN